MDWDIVYPVVLLDDHGVWVARDSDRLTTSQKSLLRAGLYNDVWLVDSVGRTRHIKEARELVGGLLSRVRGLWNWSHAIKIELIFDSEITSLSVVELKERLLESFAGRPANLAAWNPGNIDFEQLREGLKTSTTFDEVFHLVREFTTIRPELR